MANKFRLSALFDRYYAGIATEAEKEEFFHLLQDVPDDELEAVLEKKWKGENGDQTLLDPRLLSKLLAKVDSSEPVPAKVAFMKRRSWLRLAAAAVLFLLLGYSAFLLLKKDNAAVPLAKDQSQPARPLDVAPGNDKAILTLADGSTVLLDQRVNGAVAKQGGVAIRSNRGQLLYDAGNHSAEVLYNTVTTPRGGQFQLTLSDGTRVWLNADSYLRFPTSFGGKERRVELKGEAYFEVAHQSAQPFTVAVFSSKQDGNLMDVKVLGTHFNINSYDDETSWKTTLLEGSVKVSQGAGAGVLLNVGQQAQVKLADLVNRNLEKSDLVLADDIDVQQVVAWKNGVFDFENEHITSIMRQLERWYDVHAVFKGSIPERHYTGAIRRAVNLSEVIRMLEMAGGIKVSIQGREVIVQSK